MTKKIKTAYLSMFIIVFLTLSGYAQTFEKKTNITTVLPFQYEGCGDEFCKIISGKIIKGLDEVPYLLRREAPVSLQNSRDASLSLISSIAQKEGYHMVLKGYLKRYERTFKKKAAAGEGKEYLLEKTVYEWYVVHIELIDAEHGKTLIKIDEKFDRSDAASLSSRINRNIKKFFNPRLELSGPFPVAIPAVLWFKFENKKEEKSPYIYSIFASPSFMLSNGKFSNVTDYAFGMKMGFSVENIFFLNSIFQLSAGYYYGNKQNGNSDSYSMAPVSIIGGYSFELYGNWKFAPVIGGGYTLHIVDTSGSGRIYYDPHVDAGFIFSYFINKNYSIQFVPAYRIFFEKENIGRCIFIDAGVRYVF